MSWWQWDIVYHNDYNGPAWPLEVNAGKIVHGPCPAPGHPLPIAAGRIGIFNPINVGTSLNGPLIGVNGHRDSGASYESVAAHSVDGTTVGVFCAETKWVTQHVGCNWAGNHYSIVFIGELAFMIGGPPGYETLDPTNLTFGIESYYIADWVYCFNTQGYRRGVGGLSYSWGGGGGGYAPVWLRLVWNTSAASVSLVPLGISATLPPGKFTSIYSYNGTIWLVNGAAYYDLPAFFLSPTCFGVSSMWRSEHNFVRFFEFEYLRLWQWSEYLPSPIKVDRVFTIAKNVILVIFDGNVVSNSNLFDPSNYTVSSLSGKNNGVVKYIYPTYSRKTTFVFLQVEQLIKGEQYRFTLKDRILRDENGLCLTEDSVDWIMHRTKIDMVISTLANMYDTKIGTNIRHIIEAIMMSDEKLGGDY